MLMCLLGLIIKKREYFSSSKLWFVAHMHHLFVGIAVAHIHNLSQTKKEDYMRPIYVGLNRHHTVNDVHFYPD